MLMQQVQLREYKGSSRLVCWLDATAGIRESTMLTLRETGDLKWIVVEVYGPKVEKSSILNSWHVGGL